MTVKVEETFGNLDALGWSVRAVKENYDRTVELSIERRSGIVVEGFSPSEAVLLAQHLLQCATKLME